MPSSSIREAAYDPQTRVLSVWFVVSGKRYDYEDVPPETYAAFRRALSKGRFFNAHIRDRFRNRLVPDRRAANTILREGGRQMAGRHGSAGAPAFSKPRSAPVQQDILGRHRFDLLAEPGVIQFHEGVMRLVGRTA
ncbi:KTSC domain-containing protein [Aminobacter carboxidus]|uniref:KTSC domain-containing protein n=1 Tax=Aminobacter carboxidus TaxID=376165 RepID=UPI00160DB630